MEKIVLTILDGVGIRSENEFNAFKVANTPTIDYLLSKYPNSLLNASGTDVGLPSGQMGNSETGHLNIGAGRIVYQPLELINKKIEDKSFFSNDKLLEVMNYAKTYNKKIHLIGLISDGGVHSHIEHLKSLLKMLDSNGNRDIYMHLITDGRDTLVDSGEGYVNEISNLHIGKISTLCGRYYTMDRDKNFDRIDKGYNLMTNGNGIKFSTIHDAFKYSYDNKIYDEFMLPSLIDEKGLIEEDDAVIWFNFRPDRAIQILSYLMKRTSHIVTMMKVSDEITVPNAFKLDDLNNTLGEYLCKKSIKQLRIAETEKYAHVTYFFDGGKDIKYDLEDRILIPSPKVATYDLKPEMSAYEITDNLISNMDKYDIVILNFANCDMVGHTGNFNATVKAVEAVDNNLKRIYDKCLELGYILLITADHGNCELMKDAEGNIITSHTSNKVPFIICKEGLSVKDGRLSDIAPTILKLMNIDKPIDMTGNELI